MEFHVSAGLEFSREMLGAKEDQPASVRFKYSHSFWATTPGLTSLTAMREFVIGDIISKLSVISKYLY